jgi:NADH:quinone reductase (non-electrogenic)
MTELSTQHKTRVVIVGGGFGGLSTAKGLADAPFDLTLIDRNNHHLFQPLLYQVATAGLSPADIASPIRGILGGQRNVKIMLAEVSGVDLTRKEVIADGRRVGYDYLVLATGARHAYFGHNDWAAFAPGLKTIDDATYLRRRILLAFERAENESDVEERRRLMTFVVIGGGPTGVEMAGAIAELAKRALASDFQSIDTQCARIVLIEGALRLLTPFDPSLSNAAYRSLKELGVDVRLGAAVTDCSCEGVRVGDEFISTRTIMWAAGVMASPAGRWLGAEIDRAGRVMVRADLSVPGHPNVFVIGDTAAVTGADGAMLPGVAPVAKQQGHYVARALIARYQGRTAAAFRYRDFGSLATIGRSRAVAEFGKLRLSGFPAWMLWSGAHVYFLIGFAIALWSRSTGRGATLPFNEAAVSSLACTRA